MDRQILWDCYKRLIEALGIPVVIITDLDIKREKAKEDKKAKDTEHNEQETIEENDFSQVDCLDGKETTNKTIINFFKEKIDDIPAYKEKLAELSDIYKDKIQVRFGIELGLQMHLGEYFDSLLSQTPFDFVIGSSHLVHGYDPYYPEFFEGRKEFLCYMEYFESILENISAYDGFDVYGHIDYVVRYGPNKNREYSYGRYKDILDEILKKLISMGKGIELNTGGYHYGLGEPNPCTAVIRRYRELGGEIITIGADAHTPDKIACAFDKAASVLEACGFRYYTIFKDRKPEFISL